MNPKALESKVDDISMIAEELRTVAPQLAWALNAIIDAHDGGELNGAFVASKDGQAELYSLIKSVAAEAFKAT